MGLKIRLDSLDILNLVMAGLYVALVVARHADQRRAECGMFADLNSGDA